MREMRGAAFAVAGAAASAGAGAALVAGGAGCCALGRATLPDRLKFWSSLGPTVAGAGVLVVAGRAVSWASADAGKSVSPPANKTAFQRKIALIRSRFA